MIDDAGRASAKLVALRTGLEARIWPTAVAAADSGDHERIRDLVKLKVDIEAIDAPSATGRWAKRLCRNP